MTEKFKNDWIQTLKKLRTVNEDLKSELIAYHDREWMGEHEGLPAHKAGDYPDECFGCGAISRADKS